MWPAAPQYYVRVIATDAAGNTSEFSPAFPARPESSIALLVAAGLGTIVDRSQTIDPAGASDAPRLSIELATSRNGREVHPRIRWPATATGWWLEVSEDLRSWQAANLPTIQAGNTWVVAVEPEVKTNPPSGGSRIRFFRLSRRDQ